MGRKIFSHLQESRAQSHINSDLGRQIPYFPTSSSLLFPFFPLYSLYTTWCHSVWNIPLVTWGQLSQPCLLQTPCASLAHLLVGWGNRQERSWHCVSTSVQCQKHPCDINAVFSTNPNHSPLLVTMMKIKPIPAKSITSSSVPSWQCGEVASSIRKFILHPSEKLLAHFACGLVPMGIKAEAMQFIACKTGSK